MFGIRPLNLRLELIRNKVEKYVELRINFIAGRRDADSDTVGETTTKSSRGRQSRAITSGWLRRYGWLSLRLRRPVLLPSLPSPTPSATLSTRINSRINAF